MTDKIGQSGNGTSKMLQLVNVLGFPAAMVMCFMGAFAWMALNWGDPWVKAQIKYTETASESVVKVSEAQDKINENLSAQTVIVEKIEEAAQEIVNNGRETVAFMKGVETAHAHEAASHDRQEQMLQGIKEKTNGMPQ